MYELINDPFYKLIEQYNRCIIDYCLIKDDNPHQGYKSHKDAIVFAMHKFMDRYNNLSSEDEAIFWNIDEDLANGAGIDAASFFDTPVDEKRLEDGTITYSYAFFNTPHNTGYGKDDFNKINEALFPEGREALEIYEWSTDWSGYFDDGHEWWGAGCFSIYDESLDRYVVIMASTTD